MIPGQTSAERLWHRCARVKLNGIPVADHGVGGGHRIEFDVVRHNRVEPNTAEVRVYGLGRAKRAAISAAFDAARQAILAAGGVGSIGDLELEAGNDGVLSLLTKCDIIDIKHEPIGRGFVTIISAQDGVLPTQNSIVNQTLAPGLDVNLAKSVIASALQVAFFDADSERVFQQGLAQFQGKQLDGGLVLQGPTREVLTDLLESMKLAWSYQDGKLVLLRFDGTTTDRAVLLSPTTGLQASDARTLGRYVALSRLNPNLSPGRQVALVDKLGIPIGAGIFRVDRVAHSGETDRGEWSSSVELRPSTLVPG